MVTGLFLIGYGLIRIAWRTCASPTLSMPHFPLGLTMGMMLSAPMVLVGAWLIWRGLHEPLPPALAAGREPRRARPMSLRERLSGADRRRRPDQRRPVHDRLPARSRTSATTPPARRSARTATSSPRPWSARCSAS